MAINPPRRTTRRRTTACSVLVASLVTLTAGCGGSTPGATVTETVTVTSTGTPVVSASPSVPVVVPTSAATSTSSAPTTSSAPSQSPAPVDLSEPPGTFEAAMAHIAAASTSNTLPRFQTAHGDVYCLLSDPYNPPSCEVASKGAIPDPTYCGDGPASTSVGRLEFDGPTPRPICNSDTIRGENASTVTDGTVVSPPGKPVECLVEDIGVTCVDTRARTGFFLTLGKYTVFG